MTDAYPNPLTIPPEMVTELALGLEPEADILARHNIDPAEFAQVAATDAFQEYMASAKASLEGQGYDLKYRLRLAAEVLLMSSYRDAVATTSITHRFEAAKYFAKISEIEPRANAAVSSGPGMVIQINLPNREPLTLTTPDEDDVIDVTPVAVPDFSMVMAMPDPPPTPPQAEDPSDYGPSVPFSSVNTW